MVFGTGDRENVDQALNVRFENGFSECLHVYALVPNGKAASFRGFPGAL